MATSGSYDYSVAASNIIQAALEDIGVFNTTIVTSDQTLCLQRLNFVSKRLQAHPRLGLGALALRRQRVTLFLAKGQQEYLIGPASTDARSTTQYGRTTIRTNQAAGATVLAVTALTDTTTYPGTTVTMTNSDIIGIQTDDSGGDDIFWSTISSSNATGPTVTIAAALPTARPAAAGNYVYWFTSRAQRAPVIESAWIRNSSAQDSPITIYRARDEYDLGVSDKYADGDPLAILVEPLRITTRITCNAQPNDVTKQIWMTGMYAVEDYDATTDDIAFPQECFSLLEWELAFVICPAFQRPWTPEMDANRKVAWEGAIAMNAEVSNLYFQPGGY